MSMSTVFVASLAAVAKTCGVVLLLLLARGLVWVVHTFLIAPRYDVLQYLPGPEGGALENHFRQVMDPNITPETHENWVERYGKTFRFHGFGRHDYRLMSFDLRVISHVLNTPLYEKPWQTRSLISRLLGRGVFTMEGAEHKMQRRLIGPAFTNQAVKAMAPTFFQKAEELRDRWDTLISEATTPASQSHDATDAKSISSPELAKDSAVLDVSHWVSRATFDAIGLAGFDYNFHSLQDETEEVYLAYRNMFNVADKGPGLKGLVQLYFPFVEKLFPDEGEKITHNSLRVIQEAGKKLVAEKKASVLAEKSSAEEIQEKDLLSLLIKSNLSSDPSKRMSDSDLLDQLTTFLFAGSDSTALSISMAIHLLSLHPEIQTRLRNEILHHCECNADYTSRPATPDSCDGDRTGNPYPTPPASTVSSTEYSYQAHADGVDALPFLDSVVRETLRLCPPVHGTIRVATRTDTIPISSPVTMRDGTVIQPGESITIGKGSYIHIPIEGLNMNADIWGEDAKLFNPDRWSSLPSTAKAPTHPGLANVMTFSFGPHACPGWRFSVFEIKLFLYTLLPYFTFQGAENIRKFNSILTRPYVYDTFEMGARLPVRVGRYCP